MQHTLEGYYYSDPAVFANERERIFRRSWQLAGTVGKLTKPGSYVTIDIVGAALFIVRGNEGVLRAFRNVCRHRGSRLVEGSGEICGVIRCPFHHWQYALDGMLIDTPWFGEKTPFDLSGLSLVPAALEIWRGLIFVSVAPSGPLADQLGELPQHVVDSPIEAMAEGPSHVLRAPINWKTYLDQFNEYYHSPAVHAPDNAVDIQYYSAIPFRHGMEMRSPEGAAFYGGKWLWSWPNWTISTFPGGAKISRVMPLSQHEIEVRFIFLFSDLTENTSAQRQRVTDATLRIFEEDIFALSRVQSNLSGGFFEMPGPLHPRHEQATAYFQRKVREALA